AREAPPMRAIRKRCEHEAGDRTFAGAKAHQTEPVLKSDEDEAVARQRALLNRIISLQKRRRHNLT
ncbi:hypothetical protein, partial [Bradyrhizobium sp. Leo121]|uniref:hypothetical protein n=1 Tax=Bradyrhizobium sp. Leo121 TaxID=1571195 RepID=UPI0010E92A6C